MVQGVVIEDRHILDVNPATGEVIAKVPVSKPEDVDAVVQKAHEAQKKWSSDYTLEERVQKFMFMC